MADAQIGSQSFGRRPGSWWRFSIALALAGGGLVLLIVHILLFQALSRLADMALPEMASVAVTDLLEAIVIWLSYACIVFVGWYAVGRKRFRKTAKERELNIAMNNDYSVYVWCAFTLFLFLLYDSISYVITGAYRFSGHLFVILFVFEPLIKCYVTRYIDWRMPELWPSIVQAAEGPKRLRWPVTLSLLSATLMAFATLLPHVLSLLEALRDR